MLSWYFTNRAIARGQTVCGCVQDQGEQDRSADATSPLFLRNNNFLLPIYGLFRFLSSSACRQYNIITNSTYVKRVSITTERPFIYEISRVGLVPSFTPRHFSICVVDFLRVQGKNMVIVIHDNHE